MDGRRMMHYIYAVFRPNGRIMYIGKGTGQRWERHDRRASGNRHYAAILKKAGGDLPTCIIVDGLTEAKAFEYEEIYTKAIGLEKEGGPLINSGHGGRGGPYGVVRSKEWRANRAKRALETWQDPAYRAKILRSDRGRSGNTQPRSAEFKKAMSKRLAGNKHTLGLKHSEEARAKMSVARKGKSQSADWVNKRIDKLRGKTRPADVVERARAGVLRALEISRANALDLMCGIL